VIAPGSGAWDRPTLVVDGAMLHLIKMWLEGIRFPYAVQDGLRHVGVQLSGLFCHLRGEIQAE